MKHIINNILLLSGVVSMASSCTKEYVQPSPDYAKGYAVCSIDAKLDTPMTNPGDTIYFKDLSMGVENREWVFPDNATILYGDSKAETVAATFTTPGFTSVQLNNRLIGDVDYNPVFNFNVLEILQADFRMSYARPTGEYDANGVAICDTIVLDTLDKFTMEAGQYDLQFAAVGPGQPFYYYWDLEGSAEKVISVSEDSLATAHYYLEGTYDVEFIASRTSPWGCDTVRVEDFITITKPTTNVKIRSIDQNSKDQIVMSFTSAMNAPASSTKSDFSVTRNGVAMDILSLAINPDDITQFIIEIDGGMWCGDDVTVSYNGDGITGLAMNVLDPFTDVEANPLINNLIPNASFESDDNEPAVYADWTVVDDDLYGHFSTDVAHTGKRSYYFMMPTDYAPTLNLRNQEAADFQLKPGTTYSYSYWVYGLRGSWGGSGIDARAWFDVGAWIACYIGGDQTGQWLKMEKIFTLSTEADSANSYFWSLGNDGGGCERYVDDFLLYEYKRHE